jgi:hypothetical protein
MARGSRKSHREYEAGDEELKGRGVEDVAGLFLVHFESRFGLSGMSCSLGALAKVSDELTTLFNSWDLEVIRAACSDLAHQIDE